MILNEQVDCEIAPWRRNLKRPKRTLTLHFKTRVQSQRRLNSSKVEDERCPTSWKSVPINMMALTNLHTAIRLVTRRSEQHLTSTALEPMFHWEPISHRFRGSVEEASQNTGHLHAARRSKETHKTWSEHRVKKKNAKQLNKN